MNEKNKTENNGGHQLRSLTFAISGEKVLIEKVNLNQPLKVAVEKALEESGNTGREVHEYQVKLGDKTLSMDSKVGDLHLPMDALLFISLKVAEGGRR